MEHDNTILAALQLNASDDWQSNRREIELLVDAAVDQGAGMLVLPENLSYMPRDMTDLLEVAEDESGPVYAFLSRLARRHRVWLVGGTVPYRSAGTVGKIRARTPVFNPQGQLVASYDKMHLFDVTLPDRNESYLESSVFEPGSQPLVFDAGFAKVGVAVCYDLRFPELFRQLVEQGATIIVVPAAFTAQTGRAHWQPLLRARAIENQCYVVASAQVGFHPNGRETWGHSMVIDPWGTVLSDAGDNQPGLAIAQYDNEWLQELRRRFPVLVHRRLH